MKTWGKTSNSKEKEHNESKIGNKESKNLNINIEPFYHWNGKWRW